MARGEPLDHVLANASDVKVKLAASEETIRFLHTELASRDAMLTSRQTLVLLPSHPSYSHSNALFV